MTTTTRTTALAPGTGPRRRSPPAATLAVGSMLCLQVGAAASTALFDDLGPYGTTWLRLSWAAVIFGVLARPRLRGLDRATLTAALVLGTATGGMTLAFFGAIERIPLGTASSIEMLGALGVAAASAPRLRALLWPALALAGVVALTRPWAGATDPVGIALALAAAGCLAAYVLLTQRVGDRLDGVQTLALTMPVAALMAAPVGLPHALPCLDARVLMAGALLALAVPVVPYALELLALRRMSVTAFGTLMGVEPALALGVGAVLLAQHPTSWQLAGVGAVVLAGLGAQRTGRDARRPATGVV